MPNVESSCSQTFRKVKLTATIDGVALAALVSAVVAIAAVSAVAVFSVERLITTNERALRMQRTVSSLEAIRFHSFAIDSSEQSYIITGKDADLTPYRAGTVEIEAEITYLAGRRSEHPELDTRFEELKELARNYVADERKIVEARRTMGELAASELVKKHFGDASHDQLLLITYQLLVSARKQMDVLEAEQVAYGDKVRRLILALISSAAFILVYLYRSVHRLSSEQKIAQARFAYQATHDSLTGLRNRPAVMEYIAKKLANGEHEASLGGLALLLIDLDGFKSVNDNLGHDAGDELLKQVAARIETALRDSDYVARLGGDEFLIVVPQVSDQQTAERVGEKIITAVAAPYILSGKESKVTASIGISMFPNHARDRESLMKCADVALYEAKHAGRNRLCFYTIGLCRESRR
ncbi:MAG: diguanylate cyclase [Burkholderiales bacterium]|nr:diguanylate cyclase [Burkholderiales bacterium]